MHQPGIRRGDGGNQTDVTVRHSIYAASHVSAPGNRICLFDTKPLAISQYGLSERFLALGEPTRAPKHALAAFDFASRQFHSGSPVPG
jgi:hypothetical protein